MNFFECVVGSGGGSFNTLIVTCNEQFAGKTITCTDGTKTFTQTCPSTAPYTVTFDKLYAETWTVSGVIGGTSFSETIEISDTFTLQILAGFDWRGWVDTAQFLDSTDYNSLDEVLEDEEAVRELCLEHNCVDYLADITTANEDVETIINNDLFAKWVNNSDYSLDVLGANVAIKGYMDTADKYGYGEWTLMPQVPTMTSNTAPYGTASASGIESAGYDAYCAFNGNDTSLWACTRNATLSNQYIQYQFTSPICIKKFSILLVPSTLTFTINDVSFVVYGSNDASVWTPLKTVSIPSTQAKMVVNVGLDNNNTYLYYKLADWSNYVYTTGNGYKYVAVTSLQFYAWAPKGNVPVMTSNNAPYGEASTNAPYGASGYEAYRAFDGDMSTQWQSSNTGTSSLGRLVYKFTNPVNVRRVWQFGAASQTETLRVQYSDDGTNFTDVTDSDYSIASSEIVSKDISDNGFHLYWAVNHISSTSTSRAVVRELQFYGREMSVSVPKMATNTTPYGEASASSVYSSDYPAWKAFDGDNTTLWNASNGTSAWIAYRFTTPIYPKRVVAVLPGVAKLGTYKIQGSNDGFVNDVDDLTDVITMSSVNIDEEITTNKEYLYLRFYQLSITGSSTSVALSGLQFYGLDYSEKEFEQGATKKWLYDHGVELETMTANATGTGTIATKDTDNLYVEVPASTQVIASFYTNAIDLTPYNLVRAKNGAKFVGNGGSSGIALAVYSVVPPTYASSTNRVAVNDITGDTANLPNNIVLDISAINTSDYIAIYTNNNTANVAKKADFVELWLE